MEQTRTRTRTCVSRNALYGRYLEASCHIKQGEVILQERPVIVGPKSGAGPCCVSCYASFRARIFPCEHCKLAPLCSHLCQHNQGGHTKSECDLYAKLQHKITLLKLIENFHMVTLIRCILLRDDHWDQFIMMESHLEDRRGSLIWKHHQRLIKILVPLMEEQGVDEELLQKLCGILDVNSFELRSPSIGEQDSGTNMICGVYPRAALMSHSCRGNTHISVDQHRIMTVRASQDIPQGAPIFYNYANPLLGTIQRKMHLKEGKYFDCMCERCSDPTELGTHMSSLRCQDCRAGLLVMEDPHSADPFRENAIWKCTDCNVGKSGKDVLPIMEQMAADLKIIDAGSEKEIQSFLSTSSKYLSDNHHFRVDAKQALAGLLRDSLNTSMSPPKKVMYKIVDLCRELLPLIDAIEPGLSRMKAITLYELHFPVVQIANRELESKDITKQQQLEKLLEAEGYLKEAIRLLLVEPPSTPEGILCKRAITELRELKTLIQIAINKK